MTAAAPRIVLVGVGLMGGSLGLALRRRTRARVIGWGPRPAALERAQRRGAVHAASTDPARALSGADVVVLCAPVDALLAAARRIAPWVPPAALVTDVGSVKAPLVRTLAALFPGGARAVYVGAHPMAGSEKSGVENARADLYKGAVCAITPSRGTPAAAVERARAFWRSVGTRPILLSPDAHDRAVGLVSHLPHLIADALALTADRWARTPAERRALRALAAGSFRDATRVAGADPDLWRGIFKSNAGPLRAATAAFQRALRGLVARRWPRPDLRAARRAQRHFTGVKP